VIRKALISGGVAFLLYLGALVVLPGEFSDLRSGQLKYYLIVPSDIREIPDQVPGQCQEARFARNFVSCGGGECGNQYSVSLFATEDPRNNLDLSELRSELSASDVTLFPASASQNAACRGYVLSVVYDERAS